MKDGHIHYVVDRVFAEAPFFEVFPSSPICAFAPILLYE
jgi:hypothetical protein